MLDKTKWTLFLCYRFLFFPLHTQGQPPLRDSYRHTACMLSSKLVLQYWLNEISWDCCRVIIQVWLAFNEETPCNTYMVERHRVTLPVLEYQNAREHRCGRAKTSTDWNMTENTPWLVLVLLARRLKVYSFSHLARVGQTSHKSPPWGTPLYFSPDGAIFLAQRSWRDGQFLTPHDSGVFAGLCVLVFIICIE